MKKTLVFHPYFFAAYAVLGVYAQRPHELPIQWIVRPLLFLLALALLVHLAAKKAGNDNQRAGLIATLFLAWLFIGHIRNLLNETLSRTPTLSQEVFLLAGWTLVLTWIGSGWLWKRIKIPELLTDFLNITSWVVILIPLYFVIVFVKQAIQQFQAIRSNGALVEPVALTLPAGTPPDIYVIILDAYGREDFLREQFAYDNHAFIRALKARGFYVADQSQPNYPQTQSSLSSLFNFQYLENWSQGLEGTNNRWPLTETIRHSEVRRALEEMGYKTVNIPNSTLISDVEDSDIYLPMTIISLNQFEGLVLSTSVLDIFVQAWGLNLAAPSHDMHRRTILYQFDTLKTIPPITGNKFVFVHIIAPHPPFVLDAKGNSVAPAAGYTLADGEGFPGTIEEYRFGYVNEIEFINTKLIEAVDTIMEQSANPPIIILQGDHGPGSRFGMLQLESETCLWERYSILNAYYFPGGKYDLLYPSITPVNSFRVIFNTFFETNLPLLDDRNFYSTYAKPYEFEEVTGRIKSSCNAP